MKTALITGAYRGLGFEVARQLAERDFHVFVTARRRDAGLKAVSTIQKSGGKVAFVELDVADAKNIRNAAENVAGQVDHLDVLVNNAALLEDGDANVLEVNSDLVLRTFTTNVLGALRVAQAFAPLLAKSESGRIINVSSGAGQLSDMGTYAPAYSVSKAALNAVTGQLAAALPRCAVNSVCPGWVRTEMGGPNAPRSVEEGADTIVWLATEAPQELTGKFLRDREVIPW